MPASNNRGRNKKAKFHEELARSSEDNNDLKEEREREKNYIYIYIYIYIYCYGVTQAGSTQR